MAGKDQDSMQIRFLHVEILSAVVGESQPIKLGCGGKWAAWGLQRDYKEGARGTRGQGDIGVDTILFDVVDSQSNHVNRMLRLKRT